MTDTTTAETVAIPARLDIDAQAAAFTHPLASLDAAAVRPLDQAGIEAGLRELVRLRASQING